MPKYTSNLNLKKPEQDEFYNVEDFNENCDKIDAFAENANAHIENRNNPHNLTTSQLGAVPELLGNSANDRIIFLFGDHRRLTNHVDASVPNLPIESNYMHMYTISGGVVKTCLSIPSDYGLDAFYYTAYDRQWRKIADASKFLPLSGGTLSGGVKINNGIGSFGAIDQYLSLAHVDSNAPSNYRNLSVSNTYDIDDSLILHEVKNGVEVASYRIFGEHNMHLMGVSLISPTKGYSGIGLNYYSMLLKKNISKIELTFDFPVKFLFMGRRQFVPKGTGDLDVQSTKDIYTFQFSSVLNIEAMTNNLYNEKIIPTKVKLTDSTGYAEISVSEDRKTITIQSEIPVAGMNEAGEQYFYTAIG